MPRVAGVDIPNDKPIQIALRYIYGIGPTTAARVIEACGVDSTTRAKNLTEDEIARIAAEIDRSCLIEGQLRRQVAQNIQRLKEINSYRGIRHRKGLPVRGQRTRSNARTRKGPARTVAGKKQASKK